ncbi:MAG: MFS transporter [Actinomycetota bacterium]|nr:MFS transporter [Actinomycetota bacterium]
MGRRHWLTVVTAGMGFFTDAYDLFIIGTVTVLLTPIFHLSTGQISLLNSISLLASVAGALCFGRLMDRLGRKRMYGTEILLLAAGALLSAFSWNFTSLLAFRVLVGLGVGGDYSTSAVITSEYANRRSRGRLIGTVFAMQGFGLLAGPAIASIFIGAGMPDRVAWRVMLGLGAVPALSVVYLRRRIKESPRYSLSVQGDVAATAEAVHWVTGSQPAAPTNLEPTGLEPTGLEPSQTSRTARLTSQPFLLRLVGTAGCWFLLDIAFYGNSVSSPLILKALQPRGTLLSHTLISLAIFAVAALPGYWLAVGLMDRIGRKRIQWQGFAMMALAFGAIALIPGATRNVWLFLVLFAISYFFVELGPNMTTFVLPAEIFPTSIRGAGDGTSAASGKFGAFLGALLVPHLLAWAGLTGVMGLMAGISVVGVVLTLVALPEPMGKSLEEASAETSTSADTTPVPAAASTR